MIKQICKRCVMDNSGDDTIRFETDGTCNYCNYALSRMSSTYFPNSDGNTRLNKMINMIKKKGKNKKYDCLMGISGGLDSTYLAYIAAKFWKLRIFAVHIDDGFDAEIAKKNIENLCNKYNIKLLIVKPDSEQYYDLIKSFIRAEVPGIAIPQDNVLQACLKKSAKELKLNYFLSGANFALESILQRGNGHIAADGVHVRAIHKAFGEGPIDKLPIVNLFEQYIGQKYISRIKTLRPLDLIEYNKDKAIQEMQDDFGFDYYGGKHYESIFTKFVQVYYLPKKFGVDKRKSHYSSLIISGQMNREEALEELKKPLYNDIKIEQDIQYILNKVGIERDEFDEIISRPGKSHTDYKTSKFIAFSGIARKFRKLLSS